MVDLFLVLDRDQELLLPIGLLLLIGPQFMMEIGGMYNYQEEMQLKTAIYLHLQVLQRYMTMHLKIYDISYIVKKCQTMLYMEEYPLILVQV